MSKASEAVQKQRNEEQAAKFEYREACVQFINCPVGSHQSRAAAKQSIGKAEKKMRKAFGPGSKGKP